MKVVYSGLESSGKSLLISRVAYKVFKRNVKWNKITKYPRTMAFNQPMSQTFINQIQNSGLKYLEWRDFNDIEHLTDADIFIDELLKIFPSRGSDPLPPHQMDWLTQGAKSGIHIYATSQDFSQVHKQFRLLTNQVFIVKKLLGSPRPMKSRPPIPMIWGLCIRREVKPETFKGDNAEMQTKWFPLPFTITTKDIKRYNTLFKVPRAKLPDLKLRKQDVYVMEEDGSLKFIKTTLK